jgi:hypothetical protein
MNSTRLRRLWRFLREVGSTRIGCPRPSTIRRLIPRLSTRGLLAVTATIAVMFGIFKEVTRINYFRERAARYLNEERQLRLGRQGDAAASAREANLCGTIGRWYLSHVYSGGTPPLDGCLEKLRKTWRN